jgi:mycothiol synthase
VTLPAGYSTRTVRYPDDVDLIAEFLQTCDRADVGFIDPVKDWVREDLRAPRWDREHDRKLVFTSDGFPAGFGNCIWNPGSCVETFTRVHPDHRGRGIGSWFLDWAEVRGLDHVAAGAKPQLQVFFPAPDLAARALVTARGFEKIRTSWDMERALTDLEAPPPDPEGIEFRGMRDPEDLEAVYECVHEGFSEHFGFWRPTFDEWRDDWMGAPDYDPGLQLLAWDGDQLVGLAMSLQLEGVAWVGDLTVLKPWRGRGIGEGLLRKSFALFVERGWTVVRLGVDAQNETGATRLYDRAGMHVRREWHIYQKALAAPISSQA